MTEISHQSFDQERALYGSDQLHVTHCTFAGPADGESAFKESQNLRVEDCSFELRYPFWHDITVRVSRSRFAVTCRAPFWYCRQISLQHCDLQSVKAFRECTDISFDRCTVESPEFGWNCHHVTLRNTSLSGEYFLLNATDIDAEHLDFSGKYSFQYCKNVTIRNSILNTKDAFWHAENVTVYDSVVAGEYLAWYSKNLRLVRCKISGTQPFCYAENLILEDCTMEGCDLSFEKTSVHATVRGHIDSVKNPTSGKITADSIGEILLDIPTTCEIETKPY